MLKKPIVFCLILTCSFLLLEMGSEAQDPVPVLGQVLGRSVEIDGADVSSGTTLLDKSTVRTGSASAFVHLSDGQVVKLTRSSRVTFQKTPSGEVRITVHSGELTLQGADGEVITHAGEGSFNLPSASTRGRMENRRRGDDDDDDDRGDDDRGDDDDDDDRGDDDRGDDDDDDDDRGDDDDDDDDDDEASPVEPARGRGRGRGSGRGR